MDETVKSLLYKILQIEEVTDLADDTDLRTVGLDSLTAVEIIVEIEDTLGVEIEDGDLMVEKVETISKITQLYEKYKSKKNL